MKSLTDYANGELSVIHARSKRLNRLLKKDHSHALLEMMAKHVKEIKELHRKKNRHYVIETGDLLVLCLELIKEAKRSPDAVLSTCYLRFYKKLSGLLESQNPHK